LVQHNIAHDECTCPHKATGIKTIWQSQRKKMGKQSLLLDKQLGLSDKP